MIGTLAMKIKIKRHLALAGHKAVMSVINEGVPSSPSETALLMGTLTFLAEAIDASAGNSDVQLELPTDNAASIWHSCNVAVSNGFYSKNADKTFMLELMFGLAPMLDAEVEGMNKPKLEIVENTEPEISQTGLTNDNE